MVYVDWLENFWQGPGASSVITNAKQFNLCGANLGNVSDEGKGVSNKSVASETRDPSESESFNELRDSCEDDDGSVVSSSGVSVLSIDYNNSEIAGLGKQKVDLSDIGDDESTVASFEPNSDNIDENVDVSEIREGLQNKTKVPLNRVPTNDSRTSIFDLTRNQSNVSKSSKIDSRLISGDPAAEEKRKELLLMLRNHIATHGRYSVKVAGQVTRLAEFHESVGQPEMAITLSIEALNIYSSKLGDHDAAVTDTQICLGRLKEHLGEYDSALDYYCRALCMITAIAGLYEEKTSDIRTCIARIYQIKGFHREAVKELKKSLRLYRDIHGDEHITVANTVDQIADAYTQGGNHDKSNSVRGELVKLKVALHGSKCAEVAHSLTKWAATFVAIGDTHGALKVMKQAYVMYHEVEGAEATNTELTLEQIGFLYSQSNREEKAIKAHTSVAVMRKMRHGDDSLEVAISYLTLGKSFLKCEQYDKATKSLNRALTIFGKENEANNNSQIANLMDTLHQIGVVHKRTGKPSHALKAFTKELSIRKRLIPEDRQNIAATLAVIGGTYSDLKKYETAQNYFMESLDIFDKVEGRRLQFADVLYSCGEMLEHMGDPSGTTCYLEAIQIYKANGYGEEDECMQQLLEQMDNKPDVKNIEPSLKCSLLDAGKKNTSIRFEI